MALMPVDEALARVLSAGKTLGSELVKLDDVIGRVLAKDVKATRDQPPFQSSAMDGYAVRHQDLNDRLMIAGVSAAGHGFKGNVKKGQAVRVLTGAPLPNGADTIVIQENVLVDGKKLVVREVPALGRNIRAQGLDFKKGSILIQAGTRISVRDIGLMAAANAALVLVRKRPRIVLFTTGDELVLPGDHPRDDQIFSSNSQALAAMLKAWGADVINLGIVRDDTRATIAAIKKAANADILVTTGGASVGDHDYVQEALKRAGIKIGFWKIALRPGKPLMFGTKGKLSVLGLPGNPVSALVCARIFLKPLICKMLGVDGHDLPFMARVAEALPANDERQDYMRATLRYEEDGARVVQVFSKQDSSMQRNLRDADCLIVRAPNAPEVAKNALVSVILLDFLRP
jgi:molybdopterin molybdotransferase